MGLINCTITCADITDESLMLMVEMFYRGMPITIGLIIIIFGYTKAIKQLKEFPKQLAGDMQFNVYHLLWYPAASIITFFPSVIDPIVEIYTSERPVLVRALRMAIPHLIGFTNAVVYIILRELYKQRAKTITEKNSGLESGFVTLSESSL